MAAADALVERLAAGPTRSYASSKRALNKMLSRTSTGSSSSRPTSSTSSRGRSDFVEGVAAFVEKRDAAFKGS